MKKLILLLALPLVGCTAAQKEVAKTVLDIARNACDLYATQHGLSIKDACDTEEKLRPFVDGYLASAQAAGAARTAGMSGAGAGCPEAPAAEAPAPAPAEEAKTPEPKPAPAEAPKSE